MADMTTKHHALIIDAIAAGIVEILRDPEIVRLGVSQATLQRVLVNELAQSFGERLPYTHDKFNRSDFGSALRNKVGVLLGQK